MQGRHLILLAVVLSSVYLVNAKCCARGVWSAWAPSGACSDTCGSCGKITYTRKCISARNGCPCSGPVRKTKNCNIMPCKYPRLSCCGKMDAIVTGGKVICGPQPADRKEAPGPAPGTPCTAPPRPPPPTRPRTTKKITKATTKPGGPGGPGGPSSETPTPTTPAPPCPAGWSYCAGSSHCYKWIDGEYTQPEAQSECVELGGSLATVDSAAATQCLIDYATKTSQEATSAWIGLVDRAENSNHTADCTCWKWLNGSPYTYENFAPGQPNNWEGKEWCSEVFLNHPDYPVGTWNDELCDAYTRPAVCSVRANPAPASSKTTPAGSFKPSTPLAITASTGPAPSISSTKTPVTTSKTPPCPAGWGYCPGAAHCYKLVDGGYTQPEAQSKCRELGGNLAIVDSAAATQCVLDSAAKSSQAASSAWIGLVDKEENSNHTADCTCWKWLDGSPFNYENFARKPKQPNNAERKEWCTEVVLSWPDYPAGTWNDELCDGYTRPAVCSVPVNGPDGLSKPTGKPTTAANDPTTSGPTKTSTPSARPISSGPSKPSTPPASRTSARPTPSATSSVTPTASATAPLCPSGWVYCPAASRCYKLIDGGFTQPEAQSQCREVGGNLATVNSAAATQCVLDYAAQTSPGAVSAWMGLVDPTENGQHAANCTCWKWLDGSPYNYENFEPREPNNVGGKEWCTIVDLRRQPSESAGTWLDWGCDGLSKPALCSVPANEGNDPHRTTRQSTRATGQPTTSESFKRTTTTASPTPAGSSPSTPPVSPRAAGSTTSFVTRITTSTPLPCPDGWAYCPGASHCYKLVDGGYTQPEAQKQCWAIGGNLAKVNSAAATQCVIDHAAQTSTSATSAWIGLVDKGENRNHTADCTCWKWFDGSPYTYENFAPGEPNNWKTNEWCTEVYLPRSSYPAGSWNDEICEGHTRPAVCSVPAKGPDGLSQQTGKTTTATGHSIPAGSAKPSTPPASLTPAVSTPPTTDVVKTSTATTKTPPCPSGWVYCPAASHCYKLIDGEYTQPEAQSKCRDVGGNLATVNSAGATQCVLDYTAKTSPNAVSAWMGLVDPTENGQHTANCTCWTWLDGSPYNYENFEPREPNNVGGKEWCTIVDLRQPSESAGTWLDWGCDGLSKPALCSVPANGSNDPHQSTSGPTRAASKTTTSAASKPSTRPASSTPAGPTPSATSLVTRATTTTPPLCPDGWAHCPAASHCYKLVDGEYTQPEAHKQCRAIGGNLATVSSAAATQCLIDYASKTSQKASSVWIGLVDKAENINHTADCTCWKWTDGSPYNYENFARKPNQPNNWEKKEWCTEVFLNNPDYPVGTWNDELCEGYRRPALCSAPASKTTTSGASKPSTLRASPTSAEPSKPSTRPAGQTPAGTAKPYTPRASPKPARPTPSTAAPIKREICQKPAASVPFYRAHRADVHDHLYTTNPDELASAKKGGYKAEGVAGRILRAEAPDSTELYRLYHVERHDHFYTTSKTERANAIRQLGYKDEGIAGYVYEASNDKPFCPCAEVRPLYRMLKNPETDHLYTMDGVEKAQAIGKLGYKDEGIVACIYPFNPSK